MFNRKKKIKLSYDIEGNNFIVSDYIINKKNNTKPSDSLQPIQPTQPTQPTDQPIQPIRPTIDVKKNKVDPNKSNEFEKPGGIDPYYRYVQTYNKSITTDPFKLALTDPDISDAEGLKRAYASDTNTYMFKGVLYVAGTKGGIFSKDMAENVRYIGLPNIESGVMTNMQQFAKTAVMGLFGVEEQLAVNIGYGLDSYLEKKTMTDDMKKQLVPEIESLTRFKDAEQAYLSNKNYIQRVVGDSSGGSVIEALKNKYPDIIGGNGYGAPIVDVFGRAKIKQFIQNEKDVKNIIHDPDKWYDRPEKMVNKVFQDQIESALGLDSVKTSKETGIEQHRTAGDIVSAFNNSATTTFSSISDVLSKNTLTHSYELTASNISTSKDSTAAANGWVNDDKTISLFQ